MRGGGDDTTEMEMEDILIDFYNFISGNFPEAKELANKNKVKGIIKLFKKKAQEDANTNNWKDILYDSLLKKYELNPDILNIYEIFLKAKVDVGTNLQAELDKTDQGYLSRLLVSDDKPGWYRDKNFIQGLYGSKIREIGNREEAAKAGALAAAWRVLAAKAAAKLTATRHAEMDATRRAAALAEMDAKRRAEMDATRRAEAEMRELETDIQALNELVNKARALAHAPISPQIPPSQQPDQPPPTAPSVQMSSVQMSSAEEEPVAQLRLLKEANTAYDASEGDQCNTTANQGAALKMCPVLAEIAGEGGCEADEAGKGRSESDESDGSDGSDESDESGKGRSEGAAAPCEAVAKTEPSNQSNQPSINWSTLIGQSGNKKNIREFYDRKEHLTDRTSLEQWVLDGGPFTFDDGKEKAALKKGRGRHSCCKGRGRHSCCGSVGRRNRNPRRSKRNSKSVDWLEN